MTSIWTVPSEEKELLRWGSGSENWLGNSGHTMTDDYPYRGLQGGRGLEQLDRRRVRIAARINAGTPDEQRGRRQLSASGQRQSISRPVADSDSVSDNNSAAGPSGETGCAVPTGDSLVDRLWQLGYYPFCTMGTRHRRRSSGSSSVATSIGSSDNTTEGSHGLNGCPTGLKGANGNDGGNPPRRGTVDDTKDSVGNSPLQTLIARVERHGKHFGYKCQQCSWFNSPSFDVCVLHAIEIHHNREAVAAVCRALDAWRTLPAAAGTVLPVVPSTQHPAPQVRPLSRPTPRQGGRLTAFAAASSSACDSQLVDPSDCGVLACQLVTYLLWKQSRSTPCLVCEVKGVEPPCDQREFSTAGPALLRTFHPFFRPAAVEVVAYLLGAASYKVISGSRNVRKLLKRARLILWLIALVVEPSGVIADNADDILTHQLDNANLRIPYYSDSRRRRSARDVEPKERHCRSIVASADDRRVAIGLMRNFLEWLLAVKQQRQRDIAQGRPAIPTENMFVAERIKKLLMVPAVVLPVQSSLVAVQAETNSQHPEGKTVCTQDSTDFNASTPGRKSPDATLVLPGALSPMIGAMGMSPLPPQPCERQYSSLRKFFASADWERGSGRDVAVVPSPIVFSYAAGSHGGARCVDSEGHLFLDQGDLPSNNQSFASSRSSSQSSASRSVGNLLSGRQLRRSLLSSAIVPFPTGATRI